MEAQFLIAGFGGQGVLLIGQLLAKAAMHEGMNVSWMPSYGPEMRGGEANCAVVISDEPIGSPLVTEIPIAVIMNKPSMIKFTPAMEKGGIMLYNSSLIEVLSACPTNWGMTPQEALKWVDTNMIPQYPLGVKKEVE